MDSDHIKIASIFSFLLIILINLLFYFKTIHLFVLLGVIFLLFFILLKIKYHLYILLIIIPFLPHVGIESVDYIRAYGTILLIFLIFFKIIFQQASNGELSFPLNIEFYFLYAYIIWMLLSIVWAAEITHTYYWLYCNITVVVLFLVINMVKQKKRFIWNTIYSYMFISVLASLYAIYQHFTKTIALKYFLGQQTMFRANSFFFDPNIFARFEVITYIFALSLFFLKRNIKIYKIVIMLTLIFSPIGIILSKSRSGLVIFMISNILLFLYFKKYKQLFYIISSVFIFLFLFNITSFDIFIRFNPKNVILDYAILDRLIMLKASLQMTIDHFFIGAGIGNFQYIYHYYRPINIPFPFIVKISHNWIFSILVELGVVGFILFSVFLTKTIYKLYKSIKIIPSPFYQRIQLAIVINILMILIFGLFYGSFFHHFEFWILLGFGIKLMNLMNNRYSRD